MKNYSVFVSIFFAFSVANTLAKVASGNQNTCDIKYQLQDDLAHILTNDVGIQVFNELRQNAKNICLDPKAHNGIVILLDGVMDLITDPNVSEIVGASLYWTRMLIKNQNFRDIWYENVKGLNMWFDNVAIATQLTDTLFDNVNDLLNNPYFDSTFEQVVSNMASVMNFGKNVLYNAGALVAKPVGGRRRAPNSRNSQR